MGTETFLLIQLYFTFLLKIKNVCTNVGNSSKKSRRGGSEDRGHYPPEQAVADLLARAYNAEREPEEVAPKSPIPTPSTEERHQRALVRMSADLLSERQRREKIEEEKYMIEGELSKFKRDMEMRHSLIGDGLENAQQDEVASKFIVMREKHKKMIDENELLKTKLREANEMMLRNETSTNSMKTDLKIASDQAEGYLTELNNLSKRVRLNKVKLTYLPERKVKNLAERLKDQKKLEDLCREQEKIISKLEDLFSKTRINIDSRWKDDVDRMIDMTRTRQRYNPELYDLPFPAQPRNARSPGVNQILDAQEEIDGERYRAHMLERQINDMARVHAREKQDLIQRLEELKMGYGNGRLFARDRGEVERGTTPHIPSRFSRY